MALFYSKVESVLAGTTILHPRKLVFGLSGSVPFVLQCIKVDPTRRVDTDHEELFRQESYFAYLTGVVDPDCWATIELPSGHSTLFIPRLDDEYAVWMGELKPPAHFCAQYRFDDARFVDELQESVKAALSLAG
jgi:hypothetical protein